MKVFGFRVEKLQKSKNYWGDSIRLFVKLLRLLDKSIHYVNVVHFCTNIANENLIFLTIVFGCLMKLAC